MTEDSEDPRVVFPKRLRETFVSSVGVRATHALEDGATLGILLALTWVSPEVLSILTLALFGSSVRKPKRLLKRADELVRTADIQAQPIYFIAAFGVAGVGVSVAGYLIRGVTALPVDPGVLASVL